jgi:hypothetical protein
MPNTYTLISKAELATTTTFVGFTSIPTSYTDLEIRGVCRSAVNQTTISFTFQYNTYAPAYESNLNHSGTFMRGITTTAASGTSPDREAIFAGPINALTSTADTFSCFQHYLPNYTNSTYRKPSFSTTTKEGNNADFIVSGTAGLFDVTTAISAIYLFDNGSPTGWLAGSAFYLYGISKS